MGQARVGFKIILNRLALVGFALLFVLSFLLMTPRSYADTGTLLGTHITYDSVAHSLSSSLVSIDQTTGDQTSIIDSIEANNPGYVTSAPSAYDPTTHRYFVYAIDNDNNGVVFVTDSQSGSVLNVLPVHDGSSGNFRTFEYDTDTETLLGTYITYSPITQSLSSSLVSIDQTTGDQTSIIDSIEANNPGYVTSAPSAYDPTTHRYFVYAYDGDNNGSVFVLGSQSGSILNVLPVTSGSDSFRTLEYDTGATNIAPEISDMSVVENPVQVGVEVNASIVFTDDQNESHTVVWEWGDGTTDTTVATAALSGTINSSHTYTSAGVYEVTATLTDSADNTTSRQFDYVSVYQPTATGLFSAVRIFDSPAGALVGDASSVGKVKFGITAKYDQSGNPTGKVSVSYGNGDIDFESTGIGVLVTADGVATLKASGTVNGVAGYQVLVVGIDAQNSDGNTIRIQIKNTTDTVVYDTQMSASDVASPSTPVVGNIVVK